VEDTTSVKTVSGSDRQLARALIERDTRARLSPVVLYDPVATARGSDTTAPGADPEREP